MKIYRTDARDLSCIEDETVHLAVCSPPYWHNRLYGDDDRELGIGTLQQYIDDIVQVGEETRKKLVQTGVWCLNVADTRTGSGGAGGDFNPGGAHDGKRKFKGSKGFTDLPDKQWAQVPQRLAIALQDAGWRLIVPIVWNKGKIRRGDLNFKHTKRPGLQTEMIYVFAKSSEYTFNVSHMDFFTEKGDIWRIPNTISPLARASDAPFPDEIPFRCITLFSHPGDTVMDQFAGSGTTLRIAEQNNRNAVGIDLYAEL